MSALLFWHKNWKGKGIELFFKTYYYEKDIGFWSFSSVFGGLLRELYRRKTR
ncbi:hypothetical protein CCAN12_720022 [Capnocytophaga canimorsus]|uniref:Uncharacterized protein n=1 Tax=Capnocytophaga canimorsus TaxID=28188 RepID=A0A0B7HFI8_9FLAO|nr:hypothetical protein CCAN12_720022 [Capnocytophaga canimorsus]